MGVGGCGGGRDARDERDAPPSVRLSVRTHALTHARTHKDYVALFRTRVAHNVEQQQQQHHLHPTDQLCVMPINGGVLMQPGTAEVE